MGKVYLGGIYYHYKGKHYFVTDVAQHTETGEKLVIYKELKNPNAENPWVESENRVWARPADMFLGKVKHNNKMVPRFKYFKD